MLHFAKNFNINDQVLGIIMLKNKPTPTLDLFKSNGEKLTSHKIFHYESFHVLKNGTLTAGINNTVTELPVNAELASYLSKGHIISIDEEYFKVESVAGNVVTVAGRGYGSTPVTLHTSSAEVYVISKAEADGTVTEDYKKTKKVEIENYMQEFTKSVTISSRANNLAQKDFASLKGEEITAKTNEQGQEINRTMLYGVPNFDDSEEGRHSLGGLKHHITKYGGQVLDAEGSLDDDKLDFFVAQLAQKGSMINKIICNPMAMNKVFKAMRNTITYTKDAQGNQIAGGVIVGYMPTSLGGRQLALVPDVDCKPGDLFLVTEEDLNFIPLVDKETSKDIVFLTEKETNINSNVDASTIKTSGSAKISNPSLMGYITNAF